MKFITRPNEERGNADHDWLKTFHTFSFAMYYDPKHNQHGPLRVLNEDRVASRTGFGTHSHREFEIFSYVVDGQLEHKDSMGNTEILKRGDLQMTSAGTGISHSEKAYGPTDVHFLQIWAMPSTSRLQPKYYTRHFTDDEKTDKLVRIVAPVGAEGVSDDREGKGPAPVHSGVTMYASLLGSGRSLEGELTGNKGYVHVIQKSGYNEGKGTGGSLKISEDGGDNSVILREGDGLYIQGKGKVVLNNEGDRAAEFVFFDLD